MKTRLIGWMLCGLAAGCGGSAPSVSSPDGVKVFDGADEISLRALLDKPRAELAASAAELEQQMQRQEKLRKEGQLKLTLLPDARVPNLPAVWREAKFSAVQGFSVPPYHKDAHDTALALHLARHGDQEAALKLAAPADRERVQQHALDRNYPLEWTRLVSLRLQHAQFVLATDNIEGAKQLVSIHRQLRELLPEKTRASALGEALLPRGLPVLRHAIEAWKRSQKDSLAAEAEAWLAKFATPAWSWPLPAERAGLLAALPPAKSETANPAGVPVADTLRALDLTTMPAPHDAAEACWLFFKDGRLSEFLIAYRPELADYEQAVQWIPDLARLQKNEPAVEALLSASNPSVGGVVQVRLGAGAAARLPRDFGPLSLDRTFEENRRLFAWKLRGSPIMVADAKALAELSLPTGERRLIQAELADEGGLVKELAFRFPADHRTTLGAVASPLFERFGPAQVASSSGVELTWNDGQTRHLLRFPAVKDQPIVLAVADSAGKSAAQRLADARARDVVDRQARLAKKQPLVKLPRSLELLTLGMRKADAERVIPAAAARRDFAGGLMAVFTASAKGSGDAIMRELFARFNDRQEVAELRVRYFDMPGAKPGTFLKKLELLKASYGPGASLPADSAAFADLPPRKATHTHLSWQDDLTIWSAWSDGNGLEIRLRDCPPDHPEGAPLPPFAYLPRGPKGVSLGMPKSDVLKLGGSPADDAFLIPAKASGHDSVLVWFEGDKVSKIIARVRADHASLAQPDKALPEAWSREARTVGWPWRQDLSGKSLQSWATLDALTRYRLFVQQDAAGTHLLAEWKDLER